MNRDNLAKLATYLESLPADYAAFGMMSYFTEARTEYAGHSSWDEIEAHDRKWLESEVKYARENGGVGQCGAVACAVGHGPSAGILFDSDDLFYASGKPSWDNYTQAKFVDVDSQEFAWLFSGSWWRVDNTPRGAAARIRYLLDGKEIPVDKEGWVEFTAAPYKEYLK